MSDTSSGFVQYCGQLNCTPQRIVCLSAEAADWLWRIGAWEQVAGVSAFFEQPPGLPLKPRVSGFSTAQLDAIHALNPDLLITFSDVQAKLAESFIRSGLPVIATNQRTLADIEQTLALLARIVGRASEAERLLDEFHSRLAPVARIAHRPRVYFEEWNEPLIFGIAWISELIERAGGEDIFSGSRTRRAASERVILPEQVVDANPDIIFASWCGKPMQATQIASRANWSRITAVQNKRIFEIPGGDILQPGFRLVHGYERMKQLLAQ